MDVVQVCMQVVGRHQQGLERVGPLAARRRPPVREGGPSISADTSQFVLHHSTASPLVRGVYEALTTRMYGIIHNFLAVKIENSMTHLSLSFSRPMKKKNRKNYSPRAIFFVNQYILIHHCQNQISHKTQTKSFPHLGLCVNLQQIVCILNSTLQF